MSTAYLQASSLNPRVFRLTVPERIENGFLDVFKETIPETHRRFQKHSKTWVISMELHGIVKAMCRDYFDHVVDQVSGEQDDASAWGFAGSTPNSGYTGVLLPKTEPSPSPYTALYLIPTAPQEVVKSAYRALAAKHHPDTGGNEELAKQINLAYEQIKKERGWS